MQTYIKSTLILSSILLTSCVNQNTKISANLMPLTNACSQLEFIKSAYYDGFTQLKDTKISGRMSNIWRAKYQLFGEHCQIFSWGDKQRTYSCRLVAPDETTAQSYYQDAKNITQQCLGDTWTLVESNRVHDDGMKLSFTNDDAKANEQVTFSTHLVPTLRLFSTTWTIYYYVGNIKQPATKAIN
ncbi:MAG: hypothetical protein V5789_09070 [Colwellia sp.]